jgi:hypothetical protein
VSSFFTLRFSEFAFIIHLLAKTNRDKFSIYDSCFYYIHVVGYHHGNDQDLV